MSEDMVERVAIALHDTHESAAPYEDYADDWRELARAAISALREPTEEMKIAGLLAGHEANKPASDRMREAGGNDWIVSEVVSGDGRLYNAAYRAMIDAALGKKEG
jgi:hypothetical protein